MSQRERAIAIIGAALGASLMLVGFGADAHDGIFFGDGLVGTVVSIWGLWMASWKR